MLPETNHATPQNPVEFSLKELGAFSDGYIDRSVLQASIPEAELFIIHGTFAASFGWHKPGGEFYEAAKQSLSSIYGPNVKVTDIVWSGGIGSMAKLNGAIELAHTLKKSTAKKKIIVAHSHGGNVANIASIILELAFSDEACDRKSQKIHQLAEQLYKKGDAEIDKWEGVKKHNKVSLRRGVVSRSISMFGEEPDFEHRAPVVRDDVSSIKNRILAAVNDLSGGLVRCSCSVSKLIDELYLLATPVDSESLAPSSLMVSRAYSFYSPLDCIQIVFGVYDHKYLLPRSQVSNVMTAFYDQKATFNKKYYFPNHSEMHHAKVAANFLQTGILCSSVTDAEYAAQQQLCILFRLDGKNPELRQNFNNIGQSIFAIISNNVKDLFSFFR